MGIKIHHGPDGTYKTSGAIKDDIIPLIKSGRTLVTNVRGFSRENAVKVLGRKAVHKNFKVIFIDTEIQEGRDKLARFWHWAPEGAFFVVDEVQRIFKPKWTAKNIEELKIYNGTDKVTNDNDRPEDFDTAWDMQRHYSWDFVFTTTSITKVRPEMKDMAKVAIRHYNIGIWRFYKTVEHATDSKGTSSSSQGTIKTFNWVPKKVFKLYSSTKTGAFTNTEPRTAFYKDPKIVGMVVCLALLWGYILNKPKPKALGGDNVEVTEQVKADTQKSGAVNDKSIQANNSKNTSSNSIHVYNGLDSKADFLNPLLSHITITGSVYSKQDKLYTFNSSYNGSDLAFNSLDLEDMGVSVRWVKPCKASIAYRDFQTFVYCSYETFVISPPEEDKFNPDYSI